MYIKEISASIYPWDIADEGIVPILDNLQEMCRCTSVYLIGMMHHEKRPLRDFFYPHNPVRKTYTPEDSRVFFEPHERFYRRIRPLTSSRDFLKGVDWLRAMLEEARRRGLACGFEISHTILDAERARSELSDCTQIGIDGKPISFWDNSYPACVNNPDVRDFMQGLCLDLTASYELDYLQTCILPFMSPAGDSHPVVGLLRSIAGGCFCRHCQEAAGALGFDLPRIAEVLRPWAERASAFNDHTVDLLRASNAGVTLLLVEVPELYRLLAFRERSFTGFFAALRDRLRSAGSTVDLRFNDFVGGGSPELSGVVLSALKPHFDSVRVCDYGEQSGKEEALEKKQRWLLGARRALGDEYRLLSAIGVRKAATPELIAKGVVAACRSGVDGITIGHYDGASFANLRAIATGLDLADAVVIPSGGRRPGPGAAG